ncbi:hypothetical protein ABBQ32_002286 [Trebouxia sp. C0010 RCD-2024]
MLRYQTAARLLRKLSYQWRTRGKAGAELGRNPTSGELTPQESLHLLAENANAWPLPETLQAATRNIAQRCGAHPLTIAIIGRVLARVKQRKEDWEHIYKRFTQEILEQEGKASDYHSTVKAAISISLSYLTADQQNFLFCLRSLKGVDPSDVFEYGGTYVSLAFMCWHWFVHQGKSLELRSEEDAVKVRLDFMRDCADSVLAQSLMEDIGVRPVGTRYHIYEIVWEYLSIAEHRYDLRQEAMASSMKSDNYYSILYLLMVVDRSIIGGLLPSHARRALAQYVTCVNFEFCTIELKQWFQQLQYHT